MEVFGFSNLQIFCIRSLTSSYQIQSFDMILHRLNKKNLCQKHLLLAFIKEDQKISGYMWAIKTILKIIWICCMWMQKFCYLQIRIIQKFLYTCGHGLNSTIHWKNLYQTDKKILVSWITLTQWKILSWLSTTGSWLHLMLCLITLN